MIRRPPYNGRKYFEINFDSHFFGKVQLLIPPCHKIKIVVYFLQIPVGVLGMTVNYVQQNTSDREHLPFMPGQRKTRW